MQILRALVFLIILFTVPHTFAAPSATHTAFDAGEYEAIIAHDFNALDEHDQLLQVRAQLILARFYYRGDERLAAIDTALENAERIIANDPDNADAIMQLGIAWGFKARYQDVANYARKAGDNLKRAAELNPTSAEAQAVLGAWNGEAVARAGGLIARIILGARRKNMENLFALSRELSPDNIPILTGMAETYMRLGKEDDRQKAQDLLDAATAITPQTALDRLIHAFALHLKDILASNSMDDLKERIDNFHPEAL